MICDQSFATQAVGKDIQKHLKALRKSAELKDPNEKGLQDFLHKFRGGI